MDLSNSDQRKDITIVGYHYSGVEYLYKTILQLTDSRAPVTTQHHIQTIVPCEGDVPTCYPDIHPTKRTVYIVRNPKDVAVAMYKNSGAESSTEFSEFLYNFVFGESGVKWCDHTRQWETVLSKQSTSNLHLVYFDDLIQNFEAEVSRLCKFLDIEKSPYQISELCSLVKKEAEQPERKRRRMEVTVNGYREAFYETGFWKNHFTVHLQEQFDSAMLSALKHSKLDLPKLL